MVSRWSAHYCKELLLLPRRAVVGRPESGAAGDGDQLRHHHRRREAVLEREDQPGALGRHPAGLRWRGADLAALLMLTATTIIGFLLAACTIAATAFYLLSMIAAYRFFSPSSKKKNPEAQARGDTEPTAWPPVSIMIPLHGADFDAYQNYARFCNQDYPQFQLVF